jgi:G3E family GTPase
MLKRCSICRGLKSHGILIETTGLADPAPVAQTFFVDEEVRVRAKLDSIVTVVDAKHLAARLEDNVRCDGEQPSD